MKVTIKKIAEVAGVSRGTVDRALNHRQGVKPEVAERILNIADQLGYQPDLVARGLALKRYSAKKIGVLLCSEDNPFFDELIRGVEAALEDLKPFGIEGKIKSVKGFEVKRQLRKISEFVEEGIGGLVITPIYSELIADKLMELKRSGIEVVTVNTDVDESGRLAYVGCDYIKSGNVAAGLMGLMSNGAEERIVLIPGSQMILAQAERLKGIVNTIKKDFKNIKICQVVENNDDDEMSYQVVRQVLRTDSLITGICFVGAGVEGGIRAIKELQMEHILRVITYDLTEIVKAKLKEDVIAATVCQEPYKQGYTGVDILGKYLLTGIYPEKQVIHTDLYIITKYNL